MRIALFAGVAGVVLALAQAFAHEPAKAALDKAAAGWSGEALARISLAAI